MRLGMEPEDQELEADHKPNTVPILLGPSQAKQGMGEFGGVCDIKLGELIRNIDALLITELLSPFNVHPSATGL